MGAFDLAAGEKFGLIAIPRCNVARDLPEDVQVSADLWASQKLALQPGSHWKEWMGSLRFKALEEADLILIARRPSATPGILDGENQYLMARARNFYWGLLLTDFTRVHDRPFMVSGARVEEETNIRSTGDQEFIYWPSGIDIPSVTQKRLEQAVTLATALEDMGGRPAPVRFWRSFQAFSEGMRSKDVGDRVHQFVRCVEGFILPDQGGTEKQFKSRTEVFIGPKHHDLTERLYRIRSAVEHLHGADKDIGGATPRERGLVVVLKSIEAEAMARYCLRHLLLHRQLWPHFESDAMLATFWAKPAPERSALWGQSMDITSFSKDFEPAQVPDPG